MALDVMRKLLELDGEELEKYVMDRVTELEVSSDDTRHNLPSIQDGFISKNTEIKVSNGSTFGYSMRGIDYLAFAKFLKDVVKDVGVVTLIVQVSNYVSNYFGYDPYKPAQPDCRDLVIGDAIEKDTGKTDFFDILDAIDEGYLPSINIFRHIDQAVCLEHATLMQNLLAFLDIDTTCVTMVALKKGDITGHVANIISVKSETNEEIRRIYFDLIHMEVIDENGKQRVLPTLQLVSEDDYTKFIEGTQPLTIVRRDCREEDGKATTLYLPHSIKSIYELQKIKRS